ncbi:MAG TPA: UbiA family prenyltransferase [Gemmatimonadales bacterium]|nr:UbiA family prenyltransferase [Gemmatimonadales bacterium]
MTAAQLAPMRAGPRGLAFAHALRPHQWVKNLLLFVPVILDHKLFDHAVMVKATTAFVAFCCAASSAYILNDIMDVEADRRHPTKRHRPFASGALSPGFGVVLAIGLLGIGYALSWRSLPDRFLQLLTLYMVLTTAYSLYLKRVAVVDVLLLAGLYTLRVLAGVAAAHVRFSAWLLAFSMFLFLSLAFLKRYTEVSAMDGDSGEQVRRRGYIRGDREWLGSMGGASGYLSVLVLALYINSEQVVALYGHPLTLWLACPLLLFWTSRMWLLAHRGRIHDDPIVATVRDPMSYVTGALLALVLYMAL